MSGVTEILWSPTFWLPENKTWKDLENHPGNDVYLPQAKDILWSIPLGIVFMLVRFVIERFVLTPFGYWLGVKDNKKRKCKPNPVLEAHYVKNGTVKNKSVESIAKQTDMSVRDVERWLRDRKKIGMPSKIQKFRECGWHFVFYISSFTGGLVVLWQKPYFWKSTLCWKDWPNQHVGDDVYWFYLLELAFYWCLVFSLATDHRRKDFYQMTVHHIVTICLMYFSWVINFVRIGSLVLIAHDAADFPMAVAKMCTYSGYMKTSEVLLGLFIVVWILSRLVYYPFIVLFTTTFEVYDHISPFPSYYFFNGLLIVLQILHLIWTYMIARIAWVNIHSGAVKDVRSDESDTD